MTRKGTPQPRPRLLEFLPPVWVSVASLGVLSTEEITALIQESYALVAQKLSKKTREKLGITAL